MDYRRLRKTDLVDLLQFWNKNVSKNVHLYKQMNQSELKAKFFSCNEQFDIVSFIAMDQDEIVGFSSGVALKNTETAYLTCVLVSEAHQRQGIGSHLLLLLENEIQKEPRFKKIDISFFNPVHLEWLIPHTIGCDHPNTPGVDLNCEAYQFLQHHDYYDYAIQNAYFRYLETYVYRADIEQKRDLLKNQKIWITHYHPEKHFGFDDLFDDLKSEHWRSEISQNINDKNLNHPILIIEKENQIYGFAGPITVQQSGRGKFAGIGVHSALRGLGAGKVLFATLCMEFKELGASYMSIFTGETNPARKIYEAEDFKIVRSWVNMRKEI